ncbi:MAG: phenylalanine--tRNA ligase subunit beta [Candidatus Berkelbacteria bacterium]
MQVLKSWLKDYVDIKLSDEELVEQLNLTGTAVEGVSYSFSDKIVVGQIKEINPHPNADRLQVAKVFNGQEDLQIVCGAPNIAVGQKVPLALIGAKFADFEIKKAELRGIESFGMMCSERELGLGDSHGGIKVLPEDYEVGKKLIDYISSDTVFEIEITPNRGDCLSHLGVAREVAATTGESIKVPEKIVLNEIKNNLIDVEVEAKDLCSNYNAILIKNVKVGSSPDWLIKRLNSLGLKSINNIVDVTNYILFDWGQPLHAFDAKKIVDQKIIVRRAGEFEKVKTLDGQDRSIPENSLVIADKDKIIAIAGVMGAANSEVDSSTTDIIIESAEFDSASIRLTSKTLNLSTDASYRFERGIDSGHVSESARYAAKMIQEIAGGEIVDVKISESKIETRSIKVEYQKINNLLGLDLSENEINSILTRLGFVCNANLAIVPTWRHDIAIWQDLAEEVGRIYGYGKIKPIALEVINCEFDNDFTKKEKLKNELANIGFCETVNYVFLSASDLQTNKIESSDLLEIKNPMQNENKYLRNSLVSGLLKNVAKNPSFDPVLLFEIGHVFDKSSEEVNLGIIASGKDAKNKIQEAKELINSLLKKPLDINIIELNRDELTRYKIRKAVTYIIEIDLTQILTNLVVTKDTDLRLNKTVSNYKQISKYPPVVRDFAFVVDREINSEDIKKHILDFSQDILLVDLFDEFSSDKLGQNKKSLAFHIYFQDLNKALTDVEAELKIKPLIEEIVKKFKAELRG